MKNVKEHKWIYLHDIFILISILFYGQKYILRCYDFSFQLILKSYNSYYLTYFYSNNIA